MNRRNNFEARARNHHRESHPRRYISRLRLAVGPTGAGLSVFSFRLIRRRTARYWRRARGVDGAHQAAPLNNNSDKAAKRGTLGSPHTRRISLANASLRGKRKHDRKTRKISLRVVAPFLRDFFPDFTARWQQRLRVKRIRDSSFWNSDEQI